MALEIDEIYIMIRLSIWYIPISAREEWEKFFLHMNDQYYYEACIFIAYGHLQKSLVHGGDGSNHTLLQIL